MEESYIVIDNGREAMEERYRLNLERIKEFPEGITDPSARKYFADMRDIMVRLDGIRNGAPRDAAANEEFFGELRKENYVSSYLNPEYAKDKLGEEKFAILSVWYMEFRGVIPFMFEGRLKDVNAILETTIQLYNIFEEEQMNAGMLQQLTMNEHLTDAVYEYLYDYTEEFTEDYTFESLCDTDSFCKNIVMNADLDNTGEDSYLYSFGEWITDEQLGAARLMNTLSADTVTGMAKAYTEGYIRGFELTGKDISKKSTVVCCLPLGFERFMREAVRQFEDAGLKVVIGRYPAHLINRKLRGNIRPGFYGALNGQCEYDHRDDLCLFWGNKLKEHKLESLRNAFRAHGEDLRKMSGNACVESFGIKGEQPVNKSCIMHFSEHQLKVTADYIFKSHELGSEYMPDDETSFTIIDWPTPAIAEKYAEDCSVEEKDRIYREIFDKIIEINTLPIDRWQDIQKRIIDALDKADRVEIKGAGFNETRMTVRLHKLNDPERETNFENCLADVNIPAGEVFTSPVLKGTEGVLNAGYVYVQGYLFKNLRLRFEAGRVTDYACDNFFDMEEGKKLIRKVIFSDRENLPLGEFAIGTNTIAYAAARKYGIEDKLPVLIAEKTGPHFAVGDTCYSHEEDIATYNPDGKRIIARENECSAKRLTDPANAYFNVHTDITVPYDELKSITAVSGNVRVDIIRDGRFVLPGTEELNGALDNV